MQIVKNNIINQNQIEKSILKDNQEQLNKEITETTNLKTESNPIKILKNIQINRISKRKFIILRLNQLIASIVGTTLVYLISNVSSLNPVLVCSVLAFSSSLIIPNDYILLLFAGFLTGITPVFTFPNIAFNFISGSFIFLFSFLFEKYFLGIGGKPGLIAFLSNIITILITYLISLSKVFEFDVYRLFYVPDYYYNLNYTVYCFAPLFTSLAAYFVHLVNDHLILNKKLHRITSYSIVATSGSLVLLTFTTLYFYYDSILIGTNSLGKYNNETLLNSNITELNTNQVVTYVNKVLFGNFYLNFWHIGCLTGLNIKSKYAVKINKFYFMHYLLAGYFAGWLQIGLIGVIIFGGKHGIIAFVANLIYIKSIIIIAKNQNLILVNNNKPEKYELAKNSTKRSLSAQYLNNNKLKFN